MLLNSPFVVTELVSVVIGRNDVDEQNVLGFGVHPCHFDLVAGKHPPGRAKDMMEMLALTLIAQSQTLTNNHSGATKSPRFTLK